MRRLVTWIVALTAMVVGVPSLLAQTTNTATGMFDTGSALISSAGSMWDAIAILILAISGFFILLKFLGFIGGRKR